MSVRATRRSSYRSGAVVLSILAGLVVTIGHLGCGTSHKAPPPAAATPSATPLQSKAPAATQSITVHLINNCQNTPLKVRMNQDAPWMSGGVSRCAAGSTCEVTPGSYLLDVGSVGLMFFFADASSTATKAEVTYKQAATGPVLTYDISLITEQGQCNDSCTSSACCNQSFNQALKILTSPVSRCVQCSGTSCPDAFHFPNDTSKQVNATAATSLTVEFCPLAACPNPGWRMCNASEQQICHNISDPKYQACTGEMTVCCPQPAFGGTHTCYSESATYGKHPPDPYSPCGNNLNAYCYVQNQ